MGNQEWWKEASKPLLEAYESYRAAIQSLLREIEPSLKAFREGIAKLRPKVEQSQKINKINDELSKRGWFVSPSWNEELINNLYETLNQGKNVDELVATVVSYYGNNPERTRGILEKAYEHSVFAIRRKLLDEAFEAFLQGMYGVAIPVFLAQSEGALKECLLGKTNLFNKNSANKLRKLAKERLTVDELILDEVMYEFSNALGEQFAAGSIHGAQDIVKLENQYGYRPLSRHAVLHGIDTSYGTKENALKALFVVAVISEIVRLAGC